MGATRACAWVVALGATRACAWVVALGVFPCAREMHMSTASSLLLLYCSTFCARRGGCSTVYVTTDLAGLHVLVRAFLQCQQLHFGPNPHSTASLHCGHGRGHELLVGALRIFGQCKQGAAGQWRWAGCTLGRWAMHFGSSVHWWGTCLAVLYWR